MKLVMKFVVDENGWTVRYGDDDETKMTPAQRVTFRTLRDRSRARRAEIAAEAHEHDAAAAETLLQDDKVRRFTRKVG